MDWTLFALDEHDSLIAQGQVNDAELVAALNEFWEDERVTHVEVHDGTCSLLSESDLDDEEVENIISPKKLRDEPKEE